MVSSWRSLWTACSGCHGSCRASHPGVLSSWSVWGKQESSKNLGERELLRNWIRYKAFFITRYLQQNWVPDPVDNGYAVACQDSAKILWCPKKKVGTSFCRCFWATPSLCSKHVGLCAQVEFGCADFISTSMQFIRSSMCQCSSTNARVTVWKHPCFQGEISQSNMG